jgi:cytochrome c biogenesis protein
MNKDNNPVWNFFASVRLALFTLFLLAIVSIIGTIIPQDKPYEQYVQEYGANLANLFHVLDFTNMYNSWWFISLLMLFSMNLIVCTMDRLPNIWRLVTMDNLGTDIERVEKMPERAVFDADKSLPEAVATLRNMLIEAGWQVAERAGEGKTLLFSQKGAWTRLGVIAVHMSILVIFAGAIIGSVYGFKGFIMLPEGSVTEHVRLYDKNNTILPLGFQLRCDNFDISFYDSGMPREYRSDLTVLENGREVYAKSIVVNDPLDYGGLRFYQASYQGTNQMMALVENQKTGTRSRFDLPPRQEVKWPAEGVSFGITAVNGPDFRGTYKYKIWFSDDKDAPSVFWMGSGQKLNIERPGNSYTFNLKERYATGLQVAKDPGVWPVYIGFTLMLLGLVVVFFMSHRRLWVHVEGDSSRSRIVLGGSSNKNKQGFADQFAELEGKILKHQSFIVHKE